MRQRRSRRLRVNSHRKKFIGHGWLIPFCFKILKSISPEDLNFLRTAEQISKAINDEFIRSFGIPAEMLSGEANFSSTAGQDQLLLEQFQRGIRGYFQ